MNIDAMFLTPQIVTSKPQFKNAFSAFPICYLSQLKHLNMNAFIPGKHARRTSFIKPELSSLWELKPLANGRNIVGQQLSTLLDVTCCVRLHTLLHVVAQRLKLVKLFSQQLPTFLLFRDQHCCANNVGSCCVRVGSGVQTDATSPRMLEELCKRIQHCWRNSVGSCCARLHAS